MKPKMVEYPKLYLDANPWDLEPYYARHVGAMTREDLHSKADIAVQLALREKRIADLEKELTSERALRAELSELYRREHEQIAPLLAAAARALPEPQGAPRPYECTRANPCGNCPVCWD
jgi:hypothetical protein